MSKFKAPIPPTYNEFIKEFPDDDYESYLEDFQSQVQKEEHQYYTWWESLSEEEKVQIEKTSPEAVATRLKNLRKDKRATQEQVAKLLGVTKQTISNYETGQSSPPSKAFDKLSKLYGVPVHIILGTEPMELSAVDADIISNLSYIKNFNRKRYIDEMHFDSLDEDYPSEKEWVIQNIRKMLPELTTEQLYEVFQTIGFKAILNIEHGQLDFSSMFTEDNEK